MTIDEFLARLDNVKPYKSGWLASCPAHDDRKQSFSVRLSGTMIQIHCFAGCSKDAILAAIPGVEGFADLFTDSNGGGNGGKKRRAGVGGAGPKKSAIEWVTEAEYDYTDEVGDLEFQVIRLKPADGSPDKKIFQRRPVPGHSLQWALGLTRGWYTPGRDDRWRLDDQHKGGPEAPPTPGAIYLEDQRPLIYRLSEFMQGRHWRPWPGDDGLKGRWLMVVEGEKVVEALLAHNIPATTNAQGAGKWRSEHTQQLVMLGVKRVVLWADADPPGYRHMVEVATSCLASKKIDVRYLSWPSAPPKGDAADLLVQLGWIIREARA